VVPSPSDNPRLRERSISRRHSRPGLTSSWSLGESERTVQCKLLQVVVDGKAERANKHFGRKLLQKAVRELKKRRHYMKPSIKKRKKIAEAARRRRKRERVIEQSLPRSASIFQAEGPAASCAAGFAFGRVGAGASWR
jgi:small subunit ribosomal protein S21